jgi:hypothetical protein
MDYVSWLPEEETVCECRWNEARQRMDRDDCHFHFRDELAEMNSVEISSGGSHQSETVEPSWLHEEQRKKDEK